MALTIDDRMIRQPVRYHRDTPSSPFTRYVYSNATSERVLARGGISFPAFDKQSKLYIGALSVCTGNPDNECFKLLHVETFNWYNFYFWEKLENIGKKYGIREFYYDASRMDDAKKLINLTENEMSMGRKHLYPILLPISFGSDFQAYDTLFQKITTGEFSYSAKSSFMTASIIWDENKTFENAPAEMQAVCVNLFGINNDIGYYKMEDINGFQEEQTYVDEATQFFSNWE